MKAFLRGFLSILTFFPKKRKPHFIKFDRESTLKQCDITVEQAMRDLRKQKR
jgi:hypothetical protein